MDMRCVIAVGVADGSKVDRGRQGGKREGLNPSLRGVHALKHAFINPDFRFPSLTINTIHHAQSTLGFPVPTPFLIH